MKQTPEVKLQSLQAQLANAQVRAVCGADFIVRMTGREDVARLEKSISRLTKKLQKTTDAPVRASQK